MFYYFWFQFHLLELDSGFLCLRLRIHYLGLGIPFTRIKDPLPWVTDSNTLGYGFQYLWLRIPIPWVTDSNTLGYDSLPLITDSITLGYDSLPLITDSITLIIDSLPLLTDSFTLDYGFHYLRLWILLLGLEIPMPWIMDSFT